ncbi:hypothetical protein O152_gp178 [Pseudomonas phage PaBG]|uniref:Uncharacterized protein n=1 Tax=Pseudomonas phage PaBG TaxID=1335230 RepID=S5VML5_9CAUD|nr:hypothetical protein O152_gp178 [Pseudomonas phage PaBG]AGS82179.1 hypothetical protein PaBG_00308 [Pseudomonas phage PaBG]
MTNKIQIALMPSLKSEQWGGLEFDLPPKLPGVSCTLATNKASLVPYEYREGDFYFGMVDHPTLDKEVFDYMWTIYGEAKPSNDARAEILLWAKQNIWDRVREAGYSAAIRILYSDNPKYVHRTVPRLVLVRVFRDSDFQCKGHPELLLGEPIGQHHCPHCMQMEIAGTAHSEVEFPLGRYDLYRASEN